MFPECQYQNGMPVCIEIYIVKWGKKQTLQNVHAIIKKSITENVNGSPVFENSINLLRFYASCQSLHQFEGYLSAFLFCLAVAVFCKNLSGYFALLRIAFFSIAYVLPFVKIDHGTLKFSQIEDFRAVNNPSTY